jgi:hypothetical protein
MPELSKRNTSDIWNRAAQLNHGCKRNLSLLYFIYHQLKLRTPQSESQLPQNCAKKDWTPTLIPNMKALFKGLRTLMVKKEAQGSFSNKLLKRLARRSPHPFSTGKHRITEGHPKTSS